MYLDYNIISSYINIPLLALHVHRQTAYSVPRNTVIIIIIIIIIINSDNGGTKSEQI